MSDTAGSVCVEALKDAHDLYLLFLRAYGDVALLPTLVGLGAKRAVSPALTCDRLRDLEDAGFITRETHGDVTIFRITPEGKAYIGDEPSINLRLYKLLY